MEKKSYINSIIIKHIWIVLLYNFNIFAFVYSLRYNVTMYITRYIRIAAVFCLFEEFYSKDMTASFSPVSRLDIDPFHICSVLFPPIFIMCTTTKIIVL